VSWARAQLATWNKPMLANISVPRASDVVITFHSYYNELPPMMKHRGNEWQWLVNELSLFQRPIAGRRAMWTVKLANGLRLVTHESIEECDLFCLDYLCVYFSERFSNHHVDIFNIEHIFVKRRRIWLFLNLFRMQMLQKFLKNFYMVYFSMCRRSIL